VDVGVAVTPAVLVRQIRTRPRNLPFNNLCNGKLPHHQKVQDVINLHAL
jgi:hypothetical protein